MAKEGYTPQPGQRPGERPNMSKGGTMADKPTGTAVPERRGGDGAKGGRGDGGTPGAVGFPVAVPGDAFNIQQPSRTPGYKPPGKPERGGP